MRNATTISRYLLNFDRCAVGFRTTGSRQVLPPSFLNRCNLFSTSNLCCDNQKTEFPPNSSINPTFVHNRNPRSLEKLRIADKPSGWVIEREPKSFWNKITLDISSRHVTASVVHFLGQTPITVSTKEWCLKKYLYSTNDASASKLVGEVLARRCLQAGITEVACFFTEEERQKEKVKMFLSAIENGGVSLTEAEQVPIDHDLHHYKLPERPWDIYEDVDDRYTATAAQLRGHVLRNAATPKRKYVTKEQFSYPLTKKE